MPLRNEDEQFDESSNNIFDLELSLVQQKRIESLELSNKIISEIIEVINNDEFDKKMIYLHTGISHFSPYGKIKDFDAKEYNSLLSNNAMSITNLAFKEYFNNFDVFIVATELTIAQSWDKLFYLIDNFLFASSYILYCRLQVLIEVISNLLYSEDVVAASGDMNIFEYIVQLRIKYKLNPSREVMKIANFSRNGKIELSDSSLIIDN